MSAPRESVLPAWSQRLLTGLDAADRRAQAVAQGLTQKQLNWQASPGAWSVGQCLQHLHFSSKVMMPVISASLTEGPRGRVEEIRLGRFSRWFIRNYIAPNPNGARAKAPGKIDPGVQVDPRVLELFLQSNVDARELVRHASEFDVNRIRYRNPFLPLLRFTAGTGLEIIVQHQGRHLLQAEGVRQSAGFPAAE